MNVFAEPLAQARKTLVYWGERAVASNGTSTGRARIRAEFDAALAALDLIERHAQEMEAGNERLRKQLRAWQQPTHTGAFTADKAAQTADETVWDEADRLRARVEKLEVPLRAIAEAYDNAAGRIARAVLSAREEAQ